ncbi:hypothetical protein BDV98DRAFT_576982 [Pterulicium gracile]|uniref:Uncharacterized protein n=1 Tax=Pterulicium gracile TaxID=1884261 RepID=A0A5C3QBU3_9AGAR|nr:hypothetical protein BDV98DRAFT_576982 [Pterula gracilis]
MLFLTAASLAPPTLEPSRTSSVKVCPDADKISVEVARGSPFYAGVKRVARDCALTLERIQTFLAETPIAILVNAFLLLQPSSRLPEIIEDDLDKTSNTVA